jgi:alpha-tubulin suppressor-like RCC1 family protein
MSSQSACGITSGGSAYCWGGNPSGQLGDNSRTNRLVPTLVAGGQTFVTVSVGGNHACGVTQAGAAFCWGDNRSGQLGNGDRFFFESPIDIPVP